MSSLEEAISVAAHGITNSSRILTSNLLKQALSTPKSLEVLKRAMASSPCEVLSVRAISRVIARSQLEVYGVKVAPDKYKDRVRRALSGESLSLDTLYLFAEAFNFSDETLQGLIEQLNQENALASSSLAWLFEYPQATVVSAFIDIELSQDITKHHKAMVTATISSLEQGASSFVIFVPGSILSPDEDLEGCTATKITDEGHWLLTLNQPLRALTHTIIRFGFHIDINPDENVLTVPLWGRYHSLALRVIAPLSHHVIQMEPLPLSSTTMIRAEPGTQVNNYYSVYFTLLENICLKITW